MIETPVLIVGSGPVGQTAAALLSAQGIASLTVDRRMERLSAPKAHAVNPRTLEICAGLGIPADDFYAVATAAGQGEHVRFVETLAGAELGCLAYERQDEAVRALTPYPLANIAQPDFEQRLGLHLETRPDVALLRGAECTAVVEDADGITATLRVRGNAEQQVRARYVIAADGAGSRLRDMAGIGLNGIEGLRHMMMLHYRVDLTGYTAGRPGVLYFVMNPAAPSALICYHAAHTWVLMHEYDPNTESRDDFDDARCLALLERAVGAELPAGARVENKSPWTMCAQVAERYRRGRMFLAGDAAHRYPPTGGLGLNAGVGDAHNLCWKLAEVLHGRAEDALLDTYDAERRPVASANCDQSLANAMRMAELFPAIYGEDFDRRAEYFAQVCADPAAAPGLAPALAAQEPHFDSLALQLGYIYRSDAVVDDGYELPAPPVHTGDFRPSYGPGARLPHRPLRQASGGDATDFYAMLRPQAFVIVAGPEADWCDDAGQAAAAATGAAIDCLLEGRDFTVDGVAWCEEAALPLDGALLLRPDGHIARRFPATPAEPEAAMIETLQRVLAKADAGTNTEAV